MDQGPDREKIIASALRTRLERDPSIDNDKIPQIIKRGQEALLVRILPEPSGHWGVREADIVRFLDDVRQRPGFRATHAEKTMTAQERLAEAYRLDEEKRAADREKAASEEAELYGEIPATLSPMEKLKLANKRREKWTTDADGNASRTS